MLKRDTQAKFNYEVRGFFKPRKYYRFYTGKYHSMQEWDEPAYSALYAQQQQSPVPLVKADRKTWWVFLGEFYWEDENLSEMEVKALILEKLKQRQRKVQKAIASLDQTGAESVRSREPIPDEVKMFVWQRDGGKCVKCGSQEKLEFDHIIPLSMGGSNTARNIQLLCEFHNRSKGTSLV